VTFELILIALVITLEPIPLVSFLVIVSSRRGVLKGAAFIFGWLVSLAVVIAATVLAIFLVPVFFVVVRRIFKAHGTNPDAATPVAPDNSKNPDAK